jgi:hypothetical protein
MVWLFYVAVSMSHLLSLPIVVTFDSQWYIRLADILGTRAFPAEWDFLRTPLFPAFLKFSFWLWGRQSMAAIGLQTILASAGIWLLWRALKSLGMPYEAALGVVLVGAFPTLIAYQHIVLTEVGSFFFLALFLNLLSAPRSSSLKGAAWLAAAVAAGFYLRSSFLYLAPLIAAIYVMTAIRNGWKLPEGLARDRALRETIAAFAIVAAGPFLLAYPWNRNPQVTARAGDVLLFGLVKQEVFPLNDPILGAGATKYADAIALSQENGSPPIAGIAGGREYAVLDAMAQYFPVAGSIFLHEIESQPSRYLQAVLRNVELYSGIKGFRYDNMLYRDSVFYSSRSQIDPGPPWIPPLGDEFKRTTTSSVISLTLRRIAPFYDRLVQFGLFATVAAFFVGLWRMDQAILAFTAPVLAFIAMHALLLLSQDRMILPAQPILIFNLIMFPAWLNWPGWLQARWLSIGQRPADPESKASSGRRFVEEKVI